VAAALLLREVGPIAWMTFSNVERHNAVSYEMWCEVPQAIARFDANPEIRAIVLTGDGEKAFVSGADISEFEKKRGSLDASTIYNEAVDAAYAAVLAAKKANACNDSRDLHGRRTLPGRLLRFANL